MNCMKHSGKLYRNVLSRRSFMRNLSVGTAGTALGSVTIPSSSDALFGKNEKSRVSFVTGNDRRDMVIETLKPFKKEIEEGIRDKQVVIKTNFVSNGTPLCATHPDAVRGLLDFLEPMYKKQIIIAESTASAQGTEKLFEEYGYLPLKNKYNVKLVELNEQPASPELILGKSLNPHRIEIIDALRDRNSYIFSITRMKSHNVVVATLGLKNMVMGSPQKVYKKVNYKFMMHGAGPWWLNYNIFLVAKTVRPNFTVIDGLVGMEGNGPIKGTPVEHGVAFAGPDVIAVDRIGVELMGVDIADVGYLNYCAGEGYGQIDRDKIKIIGSKDPADYVIKYKLHENIDWQLKWKDNIDVEDK